MSIRSGGRKRDQFVVCVDNSGYPASLELHKIYRVIPDADSTPEGDLRIVDESGQDYLYSAARFVALEIPAVVKQSFRKPVPRPLVGAGSRRKSAY